MRTSTWVAREAPCRTTPGTWEATPQACSASPSPWGPAALGELGLCPGLPPLPLPHVLLGDANAKVGSTGSPHPLAQDQLLSATWGLSPTHQNAAD